MIRRIAIAALAALIAAPLAAAAAADLPAKPSPAEARVVASMSADLQKRFPTPADAEKAGYVRYTNEDQTGAISYANSHSLISTGIDDPSQLWYDVNGKLLGADYAVAYAGDTPPAMFGFDATRAHRVGAHVHYVLKNADGSYTYGKAVGAKAYAATGLDPLKADAAGLVKAGAVQSADQIAAVIPFPTLWDVAVWAVPNPDGAFADANPNVKPSANAKAGH